MKINEIFYNTIQGEGMFVGTPATFIRTYGCIAPFCKFCDTLFSWDGSEAPKDMTVEEIVKEVIENSGPQRLVVITGGEPFAQPDIYELANALMEEDYTVQFETSGKVPIDMNKFERYTPYIIMSPKYKEINGHKTFNIHQKNYPQLHNIVSEYKFVVKDEEDVKRVDDFVVSNEIDPASVRLMPLGATRQEQMDNMMNVTELCIEYNYAMTPRLHTLIWDKKRGV